LISESGKNINTKKNLLVNVALVVVSRADLFYDEEMPNNG